MAVDVNVESFDVQNRATADNIYPHSLLRRNSRSLPVLVCCAATLECPPAQPTLPFAGGCSQTATRGGPAHRTEQYCELFAVLLFRAAQTTPSVTLFYVCESIFDGPCPTDIFFIQRARTVNTRQLRTVSAVICSSPLTPLSLRSHRHLPGPVAARLSAWLRCANLGRLRHRLYLQKQGAPPVCLVSPLRSAGRPDRRAGPAGE